MGVLFGLLLFSLSSLVIVLSCYSRNSLFEHVDRLNETKIDVIILKDCLTKSFNLFILQSILAYYVV